MPKIMGDDRTKPTHVVDCMEEIHKYIAKEYVGMYIEDELQGTEQNIDTTHSQ